VLSSRAEGFSNSILEYMAAAKPVVATNVGGAAEAIQEGVTGFLVPAEDDALMGQRITSLLQDPAMARAMGEKGKQVIIDQFSCETQRQRCDDLYQGILINKTAPAREETKTHFQVEKLRK
jgi:L-malate glycosyltransferase